MKQALILGLIALCSASGTHSAPEESAIAAARKDLAERLRLNIESVTVAPQSASSFMAAEACERTSSPVANDMDGGRTLILVAEGELHYYHARKGEAYSYCELPSTKKRGPIGPPKR